MTRSAVVLAISLSGVATNTAAQELTELDCIIEPHMMVEVASAVDGVVDSVFADRSNVVKAGEVLAELESGVEVSTVALARARAELDSEIRFQQVSLSNEAKKKKRMRSLYKKRAVSLQVMEEADAESQLSAWRLRKAKDEQEIAKFELARAEAALARRSIRSPIDGVVVERMVAPGESVDDRAVFRIAQLNPLNVEVILPVSMYGLVAEGAWAQVQSEIGGMHQAKVMVVDQVVDAASGTFGVRLELPNPDYKIPAGLRCQVEFLTRLADTGATDLTDTAAVQ